MHHAGNTGTAQYSEAGQDAEGEGRRVQECGGEGERGFTKTTSNTASSGEIAQTQASFCSRFPYTDAWCGEPK